MTALQSMLQQHSLQQGVWLVPALPLAAFLVLLFAGGRLPRRAPGWIASASVGASAVLSALLAATHGEPFTRELWSWIEVAGFSPAIALHVDALSLLMMVVVTVVGFPIFVYSTEFMSPSSQGHDAQGKTAEGTVRFFASMSLFVGAMLLLVMADDLLLLYLGWEGVGLCSYLLIGFWYRDPKNGRAARKAFVVTRVGDVALALGFCLLFARLGTLEIATVLERAGELWSAGDPAATLAAALLLGGALGKSAQLPLHTWLPDAMAGPTPVSALIHAATMVTAGVYLVARMHPIFLLAPAVLTVVAWIGATTLLLAAFAALAQRDIKRVLAYSTISQIGYMFLALGLGAWTAAVFHLFTHAFFKALLFLGAGVAILARGHEHDVLEMEGLARRLPFTSWTFAVASAALAGVPLVTAGFYSKDLILWHAWNGDRWLWAVAFLGVFLTAIYIFRVVFLAFFAAPKDERAEAVDYQPGRAVRWPLAFLAVGSVIAGFVEIPSTLSFSQGGGVHAFGDALSGVFADESSPHGSVATEAVLQAVTGAVVLLGIGVAYVWFRREDHTLQDAVGRDAARLWRRGWGFDAVYDRLIVQPFVRLGRVNRRDVFDRPYDGLAALVRAFWHGLVRTQTGRVRAYVAALALGAVVFLALSFFWAVGTGGPS